MTRSAKPPQLLIKALLLAAFIFGAIVLNRFFPVRELLTAETLGNTLEGSGVLRPLLFVLLYAAGVCLFLPATIFTVLGAAIFGPYWGFLIVWLGALAGATAAFFIGRFLARDFAARLIGARFQKYDDAIEKNGFATVLYMRLLYFPFTPMNFGMGLTRVHFWDYFWGTGLGILVGTFIFTFFVGNLKEVWVSGDWSKLSSFKLYFSLALFVCSFFIPTVIKKFKTLR